MRRKPSKLVLISAGAALAWFLDPVSGRDRRRQVADQVSGLTGRSTTGGDPTGGAPPPPDTATGGGGPMGMIHPPTATVTGTDEAALAQAVEAAGGGEKVLRGPDAGTDDVDENRAPLRATW